MAPANRPCSMRCKVVLIADLVHVRFNSSAQDKSDRNLDTYVRGKLR